MFDRMHRGEQLQPSQYMASALKKIVPGIALRSTNAVLGAWRFQLPAKQAPACPEMVARAVATLALCLGQPAVAAVVVLCFYGLLRVGEAISITAADIHFIGEQVIVTLALTKRGVNEKVSIVHAEAVAWLNSFRAAGFGKKDLFLGISYGKVRYWLQKVQKLLGIASLALTSHSFRRGGASTLLSLGVPMANIAVIGRWASESSCRLYVRSGEMLLVKSMSKVMAKDRVTLFAKCFCSAWKVVADADA